MKVRYRAACWFVGWLAAIVLLGLLWSWSEGGCDEDRPGSSSEVLR